MLIEFVILIEGIYCMLVAVRQSSRIRKGTNITHNEFEVETAGCCSFHVKESLLLMLVCVILEHLR